MTSRDKVAGPVGLDTLRDVVAHGHDGAVDRAKISRVLTGTDRTTSLPSSPSTASLGA
jgi:hypothetical protein